MLADIYNFCLFCFQGAAFTVDLFIMMSSFGSTLKQTRNKVKDNKYKVCDWIQVIWFYFKTECEKEKSFKTANNDHRLEIIMRAAILRSSLNILLIQSTIQMQLQDINWNISQHVSFTIGNSSCYRAKLGALSYKYLNKWKIVIRNTTFMTKFIRI